MYVITGATGNIGSKAADILLAKGEKVRVVGRSADRLRRFVDKGAEAAVGNLKDTAFLTRAFTGGDAVFTMIPPDLGVKDFRAYQNEIGTSIATAIEKAGVGSVVNLSSQGAELPGGPAPSWVCGTRRNGSTGWKARTSSISVPATSWRTCS